MSEPKGDSPFYPGAPVPVESFVGREVEIDYIMTRGVGQTASGKPTAFFVEGEYGIGKSSIALCTQIAAETKNGLLRIYTSLGGVKSLTDLAEKLLESTIKSGVFDPSWREEIQNWLGKYIGKQTLFGMQINLEALKHEAPNLASPQQVLGFLEQVYQRYSSVRGGRGIFWVMDEINGIASNPDFAQFLKSLIDTNAFHAKRLPLLLMLCGVEERRREMIKAHQSTDRIFDVITIHPLSQQEVVNFYQRAFATKGITVTAKAMEYMTKAASGSPKLMHLIGDKIYWILPEGDRVVSEDVAITGVHDAAETVGKTLVDGAVYEALQSKDYRAILDKLGRLLLERTTEDREFTRSEVADLLTPTELKKLGNFLTRMKKLNVIKSGASRGSYQFRVHIVQMYISIRSLRVKS